MPDLGIITTSDGSHSLFHEGLQETYHSRHGAIQESTHVFIQAGLEFFRLTKQLPALNILEVGFGTGLNALLTLDYSSRHNQRIRYVSLEAFPLSNDLVQQLNYPSRISNTNAALWFSKLHTSSWNQAVEISDQFTLVKEHIRLVDWSAPPEYFDIIFFDAFAPSRQPELWDTIALQKVVGTLRGGGVFVTYCAMGQLKRDLRSLGLVVETLPGPPGKKEMVRGTKSSL